MNDSFWVFWSCRYLFPLPEGETWTSTITLKHYPVNAIQLCRVDFLPNILFLFFMTSQNTVSGTFTYCQQVSSSYYYGPCYSIHKKQITHRSVDSFRYQHTLVRIQSSATFNGQLSTVNCLYKRRKYRNGPFVKQITYFIQLEIELKGSSKYLQQQVLLKLAKLLRGYLGHLELKKLQYFFIFYFLSKLTLPFVPKFDICH